MGLQGDVRTLSRVSLKPCKVWDNGRYDEHQTSVCASTSVLQYDREIGLRPRFIVMFPICWKGRKCPRNKLAVPTLSCANFLVPGEASYLHHRSLKYYIIYQAPTFRTNKYTNKLHVLPGRRMEYRAISAAYQIFPPTPLNFSTNADTF